MIERVESRGLNLPSLYNYKKSHRHPSGAKFIIWNQLIPNSHFGNVPTGNLFKCSFPFHRLSCNENQITGVGRVEHSLPLMGRKYRQLVCPLLGGMGYYSLSKSNLDSLRVS